MRSRPLFWQNAPIFLTFLTVGALVLRLGLLLTSLQTIEGDEAIIGLIARRILEGERPIFFWGQPYQGSLEAYLTAVVFALFGANAFTLRVVPLLFSVAFVPLVYWLGRVTFGEAVARWSALYAALAPMFLVIWGLKAGAGYVEVLVLGTLALVITQKLIAGEWSQVWTFGLLGLLLGLALWTQPVAIMYWVALAIGTLPLLWWRRTRAFTPRFLIRSGFLAGGMLLGLAPLLWHNATTGFATLNFLRSGGGEGARDVLRYGVDFVQVSLPVLLGVLQPSTAEALFAEHLVSRHLLRWLAVALCVVILYPAALWLVRRDVLGLLDSKLPPGRALPLAVLAIAGPLLFISSRYGFVSAEPRYLLPLYSAIPLFTAGLLSLPRYLLPLGPIVAGLLLAVNIWGLATLDPRLNLPYLHGQSLPLSNRPLLEFLDGQGIRHLYADYWIANWVLFETNEEVACAVLGPGLTTGFNRDPRYAIRVAQAENSAYVLVKDSPDEALLRDKLTRLGVTYQRQDVSIYAVYYGLSRAVRPE